MSSGWGMASPSKDSLLGLKEEQWPGLDWKSNYWSQGQGKTFRALRMMHSGFRDAQLQFEGQDFKSAATSWERKCCLPLGKYFPPIVNHDGAIVGHLYTTSGENIRFYKWDWFNLSEHLKRKYEYRILKFLPPEVPVYAFPSKGSPPRDWLPLHGTEFSLTVIVDIKGRVLELVDSGANDLEDGWALWDKLTLVTGLANLLAKLTLKVGKHAVKTLARKIGAKAEKNIAGRVPTYDQMIMGLTGKGARKQGGREISKDTLQKAGTVAEGYMHKLTPNSFLVRAEVKGARGPGDYFLGPFRTAKEAETYARQLAKTGRDNVRMDTAVLKEWNKMEVLRVYKTNTTVPGLQTKINPFGPTAKTPVTLPGGSHQIELPISALREMAKSGKYRQLNVVTRVGSPIPIPLKPK